MVFFKLLKHIYNLLLEKNDGGQFLK